MNTIYDLHLPFTSKAPLVRTYRERVSTNDVYIPPMGRKKLPEYVIKELKNKKIGVVPLKKVQPFGFYTLACDIPTIIAIILQGVDTLNADVLEIDYSYLSNTLIPDFNKANISEEDVSLEELRVIAYKYPLVGGQYELQEVVTDRFVTSAIADETYLLSDTERLSFYSNAYIDTLHESKYSRYQQVMRKANSKGMKRLMEAIDLGKLSGVGSLQDKEDAHYVQVLNNYFSSSEQMNRVPLLVGQSGVAKSAIVKSLCKKYNLRMIDLRTAFMSRLDLEGLTETIDINNNIVSYQSPMADLIEVTDGYLEYARKTLQKLKDLLPKEKDENKKTQIENLIAAYEEKSKTPCLFLDEITRTERSVRQAFVKILSDKTFMGYSIREARVVAATNSSIGNPELEDIFLTNEADDVAFYDRFTSLIVKPDDVLNSWKEWGSSTNVIQNIDGTTENRQNIHPLILSYLEANPQHVYDMSPLINSVNDGNDLSTEAPSFPNYRTWEITTNYLYNRGDTSFEPQALKGLIGTECFNSFSKHLESNGWVSMTKEREKSGDTELDSDPFTVMVNEGFRTNTPTLLIGPSGCAKSSRLKQLAKRNNALLIEINLAQQDRIDLMGPPKTIPLSRYTSGMSDVPDDLQQLLAEGLKDVDVPSQVTIKAPQERMVSMFQKAVMENRHVIVFFDELNRVQNPSIMSIVFEAISDHRLFGINFDPRYVRVFAACNMGENMSDTQPLDPAFLARFSIIHKKVIDETDVKSFINYAKQSKFDPMMISFFEDQDFKSMKEILQTVDTRTLEVSSASSRGLEDFSKILKDERANGILSGRVIFNGQSQAIKDAEDGLLKSDEDSKWNSTVALYNAIKNDLPNWSAKRLKSTVELTVGGKKQSANSEDAIDLFNQFESKYGKQLTVPAGSKTPKADIISTFDMVYKIIKQFDLKVIKERRQIGVDMLGDQVSSKIISHINIHSGRTIKALSIADLVDKNNIQPYIEAQYSKLNKAADATRMMLKSVLVDVDKEIQSQFLNEDHTRQYIKSALSVIGSVEAKRLFITECLQDAICCKYIEKAFNGDTNYTYDIADICGVNITREEVEQIIQNTSSNSTASLPEFDTIIM